MEQKKVKTGHLKNRILRNIFSVMAVSMLISTAVSYFYFQNVVKEQKISEEEAKLKQVSNQIDFMIEDIENFSQGILVDETVRKVLAESSETVFDRVKKKDEMSRRLQFYNALRTYIRGSFVETENGEWYSSSSSYRDEDYWKRKKAIPELQEYQQHGNWIFSNPYQEIDNWNVGTIICYRKEILDIYHFRRRIGTLYLEIDLEYFKKCLKDYGKTSESAWLIGNQNTMLFEQPIKNGAEPFINEEIIFKEGIQKEKEGYFICEDVEKAGWQLCTLITHQYLREKCDFIIRFFAVSFLISIFIILSLISRRLERIVNPVVGLSRQMEKTDYDKLYQQEIVQTGDEIQTLYECYNRMVDEILKGKKERLKIERQKKEMEFDIMISQINPHYIYNVLNTVVYLSMAGRSKEVAEITNALIFSLQETLNMGEKSIETTIRKEIELTQCYLNIQKYRYPELFEVEISCREEWLDCVVPKTIIQPLVENAILHGVLPMEKKGNIHVDIEVNKKILSIQVEDNGVGIEDKILYLFEKEEKIVHDKNGRKHIGISNIRDRVRHLYGEAYGMWIEKRREGGTRVTVYLPLKQTNNFPMESKQIL